MDALAQHRPHAGRMKLQPGDGGPALRGRLGQQPTRLLGQVQQDGGRLEHGDARLVVDQHGNAPVRIAGQECGQPVFALVDAHMAQPVRQAQFGQRNRGLETVGRAVGVEFKRTRGGGDAVHGVSYRYSFTEVK
ncbi:hypothetical protein D3C72_1360720 [compost metagenome]